jgi:hypothetical protein
VWLPGKLARAAARLAGLQAERPALYCSRVTCARADLTPIGAPVGDGDTRFEHLLFENIAFGITIVMNRAAQAAVADHPPAAGVIMHDWWCALVVSAFGSVIYDERPGLLYRQHGGNQIGQSANRVGEWVRLARLFARAPSRFYPIHAQAAEFMRLFGDDLEPSDRRLAQALVDSKRSAAARIAYAASGKIVRADVLGALVARGLIAAGLY